MAEIVLFHHALGLTEGVRAFARTLRDGGHVVHTPDLYDGRTFTTLEAGMHEAEQVIGMERVIERGVAAAGELPSQVIYAGFSLGVLPAQMLAQTRPGTRGAALCYAAVPLGAWGFPATWPDGVRLQLHIADPDEDTGIARALADAAGGELFTYPGAGHLFAEPGSGDFDARCARTLTERVLALAAEV